MGAIHFTKPACKVTSKSRSVWICPANNQVDTTSRNDVSSCMGKIWSCKNGWGANPTKIGIVTQWKEQVLYPWKMKRKVFNWLAAVIGIAMVVESQIIELVITSLQTPMTDDFYSQTMHIQNHSWAIHKIQATKGSSWSRAMHWISWDIWTPTVGVVWHISFGKFMKHQENGPIWR